MNLAMKVLSSIAVIVEIIMLAVFLIQYCAASPEGKLEIIEKKSFRYFSIAVILYLISVAIVSWKSGDSSKFFVTAFVMVTGLIALLLRLTGLLEKKALSEDNLLHQCFKEKLADNKNAVLFMFLSSFIETIAYSAYTHSESSKTILLVLMMITGILLFLCGVYQAALIYRFRHGLYGTNYFEAKEIVDYILKEAGKQSGGGTPKIKFTKEEINERVLRLNGSEKYAG